MDRTCSKSGEQERYKGFWWGNLREENHLEQTGVGGRIILKWIYWNWFGVETGRSGSGQRQLANCCECGNEPLVSIKFEEFLE
jgi:hypothetical protein